MTARPFIANFLLIALLGVGALLLFGFLELADEVSEGDLKHFDEAVLLSLRNPADVTDPKGPRWIEEMMRDFTALGGMAISTLVTLAVVIYLFLVKKPSMAIFVALAITGGILTCLLLKSNYDRPRPELAPHGSHVYTKSFPSGHTMTAAVVYLTLGVMLARVQPRLAVKCFLGVLAVGITLMVGISRVYLAVHWPTDVLAGWALGVGWAALSWCLAIVVVGYLQSRSEPQLQEVAKDLSDSESPPAGELPATSQRSEGGSEGTDGA